MLQRLLLSCAASSSIVMLAAQGPPSLEWQTCLGGSSNDIGNAVHQTTDGGYIMAGEVTDGDTSIATYHGAGDAWLAKLDASGTPLWQRAVGGSGLDFFSAVRETADGGYIAVGQVGSNNGDVSGNHGNEDAWVVKFDAAGTMTWQKCLGGSVCCEQAFDIWPIAGGYMLVGEASSADGDLLGFDPGGWLVQLDATGNVLWQRTFPDSHPEVVQQTSDNGYVMMGNTVDATVPGYQGNEDFWVAKLDAAMNIEWQRAAGGMGQDWGRQGKQTSDGGYVLCGMTLSGDIPGQHGWSMDDILMLKLDASGVVQWMKALGGSMEDFPHGFAETNDGGLIAAAEAWSQDGDVPAHDVFTALWLVKLDPSNGDIEWSGVYGGSDSDAPRAVSGTADGGCVVSGSTFSNDGDVSGNHGNWDAWVLKLGVGPLAVAEGSANDLAIVPSLATSTVTISSAVARAHATVVLTDALGRELLRAHLNGNTCTLNVADLPRGPYMITVGTSGRDRSTQRVVLE